MSILVTCSCGKTLRAKEQYAGQKARCPNCGAVLQVPELPPTEILDAYALAPPTPAEPETEIETPPRHRPSAPASLAVPGDEPPRGSAREFLYLALALTLIPLALSLVARTAGPSIEERIARALRRAKPEEIARVRPFLRDVGEGKMAFDPDLIAQLPGGRIDEDAHLPRDSYRHWLYAAVTALAFWAVIAVLFPLEERSPLHLLLVGLFTGTVGIILLLGFQFVAGATQGVWLRGRGIVVLLFYVAKFIGFSYEAARDPENGFLLSFLGYTCGVGLCEELCKALPLVVHFRRDPRMGWRGACVWGLASGVGFGVSEGIMYSAQYYNGIHPAGLYVVRFVSCAALHAIWTAAVGISLWRRQDAVQGDTDALTLGLAVVGILAVPMALHGLYDTLLKKEMNLWALLIGVASFAWLAVQVEWARAQTREDDLAPRWAGAA